MTDQTGFEGQVELALGRALAYLGRRDRSVAEVRKQLLKRGFPGDVAEGAIERLSEMGYLDDLSFARRFAEDRRRLDGWGDRRIRQRLSELGTDREAIDQALAGEKAGSELERAIALLERRLAEPAERDSDRRRALGILVRRGYSLETASDAVRAHRQAHSRAN